MATVTVPGEIAALAASEAEAAGYASAGDYLGDLVRSDRMRKRSLHDLLIEGEESGVSPYTIDEIIEQAFAKPLRS